MSDHKGAALIYPMLPDAETIIADKGYDSDAFRDALGIPVMHNTGRSLRVGFWTQIRVSVLT